MAFEIRRLTRLETWRRAPDYAACIAKKAWASKPVRACMVTVGRRWTGVIALSVGDQNDYFFHFGWETLSVVPPADHLANITHDRLPFEDDSIEVLNASHVLEHLRDSELRHFLREAYRVLSPSGTFRIAVPDLERFIESYHRDGLAMHFDWPMCSFSNMRAYKENEVRAGREYPDALLPHNGLISIVAIYTNGHRLPVATKEEVEEHLRTADIDHFVHWCVSLKDTEREDFGHCNGFSFDRLSRFFEEAGFSSVTRSTFGDTSNIRLLRGIDRHTVKTISLFVNASKKK